MGGTQVAELVEPKKTGPDATGPAKEPEAEPVHSTGIDPRGLSGAAVPATPNPGTHVGPVVLPAAPPVDPAAAAASTAPADLTITPKEMKEFEYQQQQEKIRTAVTSDRAVELLSPWFDKHSPDSYKKMLTRPLRQHGYWHGPQYDGSFMNDETKGLIGDVARLMKVGQNNGLQRNPNMKKASDRDIQRRAEHEVYTRDKACRKQFGMSLARLKDRFMEYRQDLSLDRDEQFALRESLDPDNRGHKYLRRRLKAVDGKDAKLVDPKDIPPPPSARYAELDAAQRDGRLKVEAPAPPTAVAGAAGTPGAATGTAAATGPVFADTIDVSKSPELLRLMGSAVTDGAVQTELLTITLHIAIQRQYIKQVFTIINGRSKAELDSMAHFDTHAQSIEAHAKARLNYKSDSTETFAAKVSKRLKDGFDPTTNATEFQNGAGGAGTYERDLYCATWGLSRDQDVKVAAEIKRLSGGESMLNRIEGELTDGAIKTIAGHTYAYNLAETEDRLHQSMEGPGTWDKALQNMLWNSNMGPEETLVLEALYNSAREAETDKGETAETLRSMAKANQPVADWQKTRDILENARKNADPEKMGLVMDRLERQLDKDPEAAIAKGNDIYSRIASDQHHLGKKGWFKD